MNSMPVWYRWVPGVLIGQAIGFLIGLLVLALLTIPARAGSCGVVYPIQSYSNVKAAVHDYHAEKRITVLEYVPLYFVGNAHGYTAPAPAPAATAPAASPCDAKVSALEAKLAALEAKLSASAPTEKPVPVQPEPVTAPPSKSALVQHCGSCHDQNVSASKGGKVSLTNGETVLRWTAETTGKVFRSVSDGSMPKGGKKLSEEQFNVMLQELVNIHSSK